MQIEFSVAVFVSAGRKAMNGPSQAAMRKSSAETRISMNKVGSSFLRDW